MCAVLFVHPIIHRSSLDAIVNAESVLAATTHSILSGPAGFEALDETNETLIEMMGGPNRIYVVGEKRGSAGRENGEGRREGRRDKKFRFGPRNLLLGKYE